MFMGTCIYIHDILFWFCVKHKTTHLVFEINLVFYINLFLFFVLLFVVIRQYYFHIILFFTALIYSVFIIFDSFSWEIKQKIIDNWVSHGQNVIWLACLVIFVLIIIVFFTYVETLHVYRCWKTYKDTRNLFKTIISLIWLMIVELSVCYFYLWLIVFIVIICSVGFLYDISITSSIEDNIQIIKTFFFSDNEFYINIAYNSIYVTLTSWYIKCLNKWIYPLIPIEDILETEW